ncbi:hypothetical protein QVD17_00070 [Tagetes erecta]|uniref:Reverse transcriptase zinc-binding domain-containing protein n=1 Tax=Tagetes erecta TaxID=13708 RepID=A0AAD8L3X5_TARER|nr:hypothetical protein QVD17_00070 [Tagetes erecta]
MRLRVEVVLKVANLRKELEDLQQLIDASPFDLILKEKESLCMKEFVDASLDEESFLKQKAKVNWLDQGDANTKYFHNMLKCKNNKKMIDSVMRSTGEVLEGDAMVDEFVTFYETFLGGEHVQPSLPDSSIFSRRLDANISLAKEIEVKLRRFLWGAKQEKKVNAKVAWKKVCLPMLEDGEDKLCWREGSKLIPFSTSNAWEHIRHKVENVEWAECVWFPQCIPKHAFNMWLICQGEE